MSKKNRGDNAKERGGKSKNAKGKKARREQTEKFGYAEFDRFVPKAPPKQRDSRPIVAKTKRQGELMRNVDTYDINFAIGPAGTGKTYLIAGLACDLLVANKLDQIVLVRPTEKVDEDLGFTTGNLEEKFAIHLEPFWDVFNERLGHDLTQYFIQQRRIIMAPLGTMRGRTFKNSWVILDEAQNTTKKQMKMFLTRIGEGSKFIINGDLTQIDLKRDVLSGLQDALKRFRTHPRFGCVEFKEEDIVRHGLIQDIIRAYEN